MRLLTEGDVLEGVEWTGSETTLQPIQDEPYPLRLHGAHKGSDEDGRPTWSEARIPRHLAYPVEVGKEENPPEHMALRALDYARAGCVVLTRLVKVAAKVERRERIAK